MSKKTEQMPSKNSPQISASTNGPLIVKNLTGFVGVDGEAIASEAVMALCRCGQSKKRPFCDGTHAKVGFVDSNDGGSKRDERKSYTGKRITIHDNRGICSHAADCTERLSSVFNHNQPQWINPDNAEVEEIIEIYLADSDSLAASATRRHRDFCQGPCLSGTGLLM